jgi:hypothetical protein
MAEVETYSKQISASFSDRDAQFFLFTTFSPPNDQLDIEKGTLTLSITDGVQFWRSKESLSAEELSKASGRGRVKPALEALTEKLPSTHLYTFSIENRDDDLFLSIYFTLKAGAARSRLRVQLFPVDNAKAEVASTLDTMIFNLERLRVATNELRKGKSVLENEVTTIKSLKQEFAANRQQREQVERKYYQGIAALLNIKKKQLRAAAGREEDGHEEEPMDEIEEQGQGEAMDVSEENGEGLVSVVDDVASSVQQEGIEETNQISESEEPQSPDREYDKDD